MSLNFCSLALKRTGVFRVLLTQQRTRGLMATFFALWASVSSTMGGPLWGQREA
jgi:hypothetical protein